MACRQRVSPSRQKSRLPRGADHQRQDHGRRCRPRQSRPKTAPAPHRVGPPHQGNEQPDLRQIRVAVGHRLAAHLDQADDRNEHSREPEPAAEKVGKPAPEPNHRRGNAQQRQARDRNQQGRPAVGAGGGSTRPGSPATRSLHILAIRNQGIRRTVTQRMYVQLLHGLLLGPKRDRATRRRQGHQRQFFRDQSPHRHGRPGVLPAA